MQNMQTVNKQRVKKHYSLVIHAEDVVQVVLLSFIFNQRLHLQQRANIRTHSSSHTEPEHTHSPSCGPQLWAFLTNLMATQLQKNRFEEAFWPVTDITHVFSLLSESAARHRAAFPSFSDYIWNSAASMTRLLRLKPSPDHQPSEERRLRRWGGTALGSGCRLTSHDTGGGEHSHTNSTAQPQQLTEASKHRQKLLTYVTFKEYADYLRFNRHAAEKRPSVTWCLWLS